MRALFTAATGMTAQQQRIDNIANNLSNVSTNGFKKARETFEDLVYQDNERCNDRHLHNNSHTRWNVVSDH